MAGVVRTTTVEAALDALVPATQRR
jgi:hypothetical protein